LLLRSFQLCHREAGHVGRRGHQRLRCRNHPAWPKHHCRLQGLDRILLQPARAELQFRIAICPDSDDQMQGLASMRIAAGVARVVLFAGLSLLFVATAARTEFKPISPFAATEVAPGPPSAFAPPTAAPFQAPGQFGRVFAWVFDKQQSLQRTLAMSVKSLKTDPLSGALTLALLSFIYGVLHAVGPGHGKTIIS